MSDFDRIFPPTDRKPLPPLPVRRLPRKRTPRLPARPPAVPLSRYVELPVPEASNRWRAYCVHGKCRWRETYRDRDARLTGAQTHAAEHGWVR